jgi:hypothetical protein
VGSREDANLGSSGFNVVIALLAIVKGSENRKIMKTLSFSHGNEVQPVENVFSSPDEVLVADRDRLDEILLQHLKTYEGGGTVRQPVGGFNRDHYIAVMEGKPKYLGPLPTEPEAEVSRRMLEAWNSLVIKGYLMPNRQSHPDHRTSAEYDFGPSLLLLTFRDPKYVRNWVRSGRASAAAFCGRRRNRVIVVKYPQQT